MLHHHYLSQPIDYTGHQLSPHWIFRNFGYQGDAIVSFTGSCRVELSEMVDLADVRACDDIFSPRMLHFIAEFFEHDLMRMVYRQRLFIAIMGETLRDILDSQPDDNRGKILRRGDDLFLLRPDGTRGKLSVSIATQSIVSTLMHTGINIETDGTPVPTAGLNELAIAPEPFARRILESFAFETASIFEARCKVRGVS